VLSAATGSTPWTAKALGSCCSRRKSKPVGRRHPRPTGLRRGSRFSGPTLPVSRWRARNWDPLSGQLSRPLRGWPSPVGAGRPNSAHALVEAAGGMAIRRQRMLRDVVESDLPILYEQQLDPESARMTAFPPREEWAVFLAHWTKILGDPACCKQTIVWN